MAIHSKLAFLGLVFYRDEPGTPFDGCLHRPSHVVDSLWLEAITRVNLMWSPVPEARPDRPPGLR